MVNPITLIIISKIPLRTGPAGTRLWRASYLKS